MVNRLDGVDYIVGGKKSSAEELAITVVVLIVLLVIAFVHRGVVSVLVILLTNGHFVFIFLPPSNSRLQNSSRDIRRS